MLWLRRQRGNTLFHLGTEFRRESNVIRGLLQEQVCHDELHGPRFDVDQIC
jgi:hypothetical protein